MQGAPNGLSEQVFTGTGGQYRPGSGTRIPVLEVRLSFRMIRLLRLFRLFEACPSSAVCRAMFLRAMCDIIQS